MSSWKRLACLYVLIFLPLPAHSADVGIDRSKSWFRPTLDQGDEEICNIVHRDAEKFFLTDNPWSGLRAPAAQFYVTSLGAAEYVRRDDGDRIGTFSFGERTVYYRQYTNWSNCCMGEQLLEFSPQPFLASDRGYPKNAITPMENGFFQLVQYQGKPYAVTVSLRGDNSEVSRIDPDLTLHKVCRLSLIPSITPLALSAAQAQLSALLATLEPVRGQEGNCGTGHFLSWRTIQMQRKFDQILYRPWTVAASIPHGANFSQVENLLQKWQLHGVFESAALPEFQHQFAKTLASIEDYLIELYGVDAAAAKSYAEQVVKAAVAVGFTNSEGMQYQENELILRQAISAGQPLSKIRVLSLDGIDRNPKADLFGRTKESVLNLAITQPAIVAYLLDNGFNPNTENAFGKTPLMYAAQYNALDSTKLLLAHGGDPNQVTTKPSDTCFYRLNTAGVSALHYAARYASVELLQALIDGGADAFLKATNRNLYPVKEESALDWLSRYTAGPATESNPNLPADQVPAAIRLLQPPSAEGLQNLVQSRLELARKSYAAGEVDNAYRLLRSVLAISPENDAALSDFSLIALRNDRLGESLAASAKLTARTQDATLAASGWFNTGLACEQSAKQQKSRSHSIFHDGTSYCTHDLLHSF